MRLGEIKQKIDEVTNSQNQIEFLLEDQGNGYTYTIKNLKKILDFAQLAITLKIGNANEEVLKSILTNEPRLIDNQISTNSYTQLQNSVITPINQSLLQIYPFLDKKVQLQESNVINIKIPANIVSLDGLYEQIKRYDLIFKKVKVNGGQVKFNSFDNGSSWIEISVLGVSMYKIILGLIKISKDYYEYKEQYYKSKTAEKDYKASLIYNHGNKTTPTIEEYTQNRLKIEITHLVEEFIEEVAIDESDITNAHEFKTGIISACVDLSVEIENGSQFHLSLNPPKGVTESNNFLKIDYEEIKKIEIEEKKQLTLTQIED